MRHETARDLFQILRESLYACTLSKGAERPTNQHSRLRKALAEHWGPRTFDFIWEAFQNDLSPRRCTTTHAQYQKWAGPAGNTNSYKSPERRIVHCTSKWIPNKSVLIGCGGSSPCKTDVQDHANIYKKKCK